MACMSLRQKVSRICDAGRCLTSSKGIQTSYCENEMPGLQGSVESASYAHLGSECCSYPRKRGD